MSDEVSTQITVFMINGQSYGVDINDVNEIIRMQPITALPNKASHIEGITNLRGKICTVVSARELLGFEKIEITENQNIMVLSDGRIGMVVDEVTEIVTIEDTDIKSLEGMSALEAMKGIDYIVEKNGEIITVLKIEGLIIPEKSEEESITAEPVSA